MARRPKSSSRTFYQVFDLAPGEDEETLKARYRELTRKYHPDRKNGDHSRFWEITEAGATLLDSDRRKAYDAKLRFTRKPCPKCDGDGRRFIQITFTQRVSRRCEACNGVGYEADLA